VRVVGVYCCSVRPGVDLVAGKKLESAIVLSGDCLWWFP